MSIHCVQNGWYDIHFCDPDCRMHGATLAEILHCLQVGRFVYSLDGLFLQKKKRERVPTKKKSSTTCCKGKAEKWQFRRILLLKMMTVSPSRIVMKRKLTRRITKEAFKEAQK
jgi:hypothetical protein